MDRKKWILLAAAGVLVSQRSVLATGINIEARIDSALDNARQDVRNEQPLVVGTSTHASSDELPARMY